MQKNLSPLLSLDDFLAKLPSWVSPITATLDVRLEQALHHVTAEIIYAPYALPPFDNTGVDGYAFRHQDAVSGALKLIGQSLAGEPFSGELPAGCAVHIATGAVLPNGADTVVMQEYTHIDGQNLAIENMPTKGSNIRRHGNDLDAGQIALAAGHILRAQDIALLGALGFTTVKVIRPLRIGIAATGTELRESGTALKPGQIINTNSLMLKHLLTSWPVDVTILEVWPDNYALTESRLRDAATQVDLLISSGGVSVGQRDFMRDALRTLGTVHHWKIAIRPGKPVMLGQIGACVILGLPGNPVSALVTFMLIGQAVLNALLGRQSYLPQGYQVTLAEPIACEKNLRCFPRARLENRQDKLYAVPYHDQSSNLLTSLTNSDGVLDIPMDQGTLKAGEAVIFRPYANFG